MSAQGGTLARRGAVHLPIWPVAAVLAAVIAGAVGMSILSGTEGGVVTSVTDTERFANSSAAVREQGATLPFEQSLNPGMWTITQAESYLARLAAVEGSTAAVREQGAGLAINDEVSGYQAWHVGMVAPAQTLSTYPVGLENPGAYLGEAVIPAGIAPPAEPHQPITVNGEPCHQCI
jgi:hypothetical protein